MLGLWYEISRLLPSQQQAIHNLLLSHCHDDCNQVPELADDTKGSVKLVNTEKYLPDKHLIWHLKSLALAFSNIKCLLVNLDLVSSSKSFWGL